MACQGCDEEKDEVREMMEKRFVEQEATIHAMRQEIDSLETRIDNLLGAHFLLVKEAMSR